MDTPEQPPAARPLPSLRRNILGSIVLFVVVWVFGGMNIEMRIVFTAYVFLAVSFVGWVLWLLRLLPPRMLHPIQVAVFPLMCAVWIGVAIVDWRRGQEVLPTKEYNEYFPRSLYPLDRRTVSLLAKPTLSLTDKLPAIDGATSLHDLYHSFSEAVASESRQPYNQVRSSRTPEAYGRLISEEADSYSRKTDMIFVFRPSRKQVEAAAAAGKELRITPIGYDAFVFFVNEHNPVDNLTIGQLKDIYSGRLTRWSDAGGDNSRVLPFQRFEGSGSQGSMERFMEDDTLMEPESEHRFRFMMGIITNTARYRNLESAIGYSFLYYVETMQKGGGVKLLGVNGVPPSKETIRDRSYPLIEEICIVTVGEEHNPNIRKFIDWILSPQGQAMVEAIGYVPVHPATEERPFPPTRIDR